jgi:hypothetical protein
VKYSEALMRTYRLPANTITHKITGDITLSLKMRASLLGYGAHWFFSRRDDLYG